MRNLPSLGIFLAILVYSWPLTMGQNEEKDESRFGKVDIIGIGSYILLVCPIIKFSFDLIVPLQDGLQSQQI